MTHKILHFVQDDKLCCRPGCVTPAPERSEWGSTRHLLYGMRRETSPLRTGRPAMVSRGSNLRTTAGRHDSHTLHFDNSFFCLLIRHCEILCHYAGRNDDHWFGKGSWQSAFKGQDCFVAALILCTQAVAKTNKSSPPETLLRRIFL